MVMLRDRSVTAGLKTACFAGACASYAGAYTGGA